MGARSYGQYCGLARALDIIGERWSLLIVRELLVGPARYSDLAARLPGIATNLLADRLKALAAAGVVERRLADDRNSVLYALTPWGEQLREPVEALLRWSLPLMRSGPGEDAFRGHWLAVALRALLHGRTSHDLVTVGVECHDTRLAVQVDQTGPSVVLHPDPLPSTTLRARAEVVLGLAAGELGIEEALEVGELRGDPEVLAEVFTSTSRGSAGR